MTAPAKPRCSHTLQVRVDGHRWLCVCELGTVSDHPRRAS